MSIGGGLFHLTEGTNIVPGLATCYLSGCPWPKCGCDRSMDDDGEDYVVVKQLEEP